MRKGFNDSEETFEDAIKINRCIECIYKRKRYWIDLATINGVQKRAIWQDDKVLATFDSAEDFLANAQIDDVPIAQVIAESTIVSY